MSMKLASLFLMFAAIGCATAPPIISPTQGQAFAEVVRAAEAEGAANEPPEAVRLLREAKSGFAYAQRLPMDPDHARRVLAKAQSDAEAALQLARRRHQEEAIVNLKLRREAAVDALAATAAPAGEASEVHAVTTESVASPTTTAGR
jgi:hypothetical protein